MKKSKAERAAEIAAEAIAEWSVVRGQYDALLAATTELRRGDGTYYLTEERAMAPGIADGWPDVIPAPHTKNGRLVKRKFAIVDAQ